MRTLMLVLAGALTLVAPMAGAATCTTQVDQLCDAGRKAGLGDYGDVIIAAVAFVLLVGFLVLLVLLFSGRSTPKISVAPREQVREVSPGGTVQLLVDVENLRKRTSVDVWVDVPPLPAGWDAAPFAALELPSGFTAPVAITEDQPLHLSSAKKGAHKAAVAVQLLAPTDAAQEETIEIPVRLVPTLMGTPRGAGEEVHYSVLLTTRRPVLSVQSVVHTPDHVTAGEPVVTRAVVENRGEAEAHDVAVAFLLNDQAVDRKTVAVMGPRAAATVEFNWTPTAGENRIRISVG